MIPEKIFIEDTSPVTDTEVFFDEIKKGNIEVELNLTNSLKKIIESKGPFSAIRAKLIFFLRGIRGDDGGEGFDDFLKNWEDCEDGWILNPYAGWMPEEAMRQLTLAQLREDIQAMIEWTEKQKVH